METGPDKPLGITLADVRNALGEVSPFSTGGSALREIIGRGSLATIQKHLKTLREECVAASKPVDEEIPTPDPDVVRTIWAMAWNAARQKVLLRLDQLSAQRDLALMQVKTLEGDTASLAMSLDSALDAVAQQRDETARQLADRGSEMTQLQAANDALTLQLEQLRSDLRRMSTESEHSRALSERDAQLKDRAHLADREHLLNQLAEIKSALHSASGRVPMARSDEVRVVAAVENP